jgi:hypothetical protein
VKGLNKKRPTADTEILSERLAGLANKRQRVLDYYFEGGINPAERDARIAEIENEHKIISGLLAKNKPNPTLETDRLVELFSVFAEFDLLQRSDKRALLGAIAPEILVSDYRINGLFFSLDMTPAAAVYPKAERIWLPIAA